MMFDSKSSKGCSHVSCLQLLQRIRLFLMASSVALLIANTKAEDQNGMVIIIMVIIIIIINMLM